MKIMAPAMAWTYLSRNPSRMKRTPQEAAAMIVNMVKIVVKPKARVTNTTPPMLCLAAGYIRSGMRGSQGPKTKMVKRIQGVSDDLTFSS